MKHIFGLILMLIFHINIEAQSNKTAPLSIGESLEFYSDILNENRIINVYLPQNYKTDSLKKYPVIYLLDGSIDEDIIHIAGIVQFCSFSWINIIPESIVVGIGNIDRKRDFTYPSTAAIDRKEFPTSGESAKFIDFIAEELQQEINNRYRTTSEKTIIGQSLGGLLATEILFKYSNLFDHYIIASPSLWWDEEKLLQYKINDNWTVKSIYIAVGKEGPVMERLAKTLHEKIKTERKSDFDLHYSFFEKQKHGDVLHLAVYDAFEKLFKKPEIK